MEEKYYIINYFLSTTGTGADFNNLIDLGERKKLIDSALFQDLKKLLQLYWDYLKVNVGVIYNLVLTGHHIDQTGCLQRFVKRGSNEANQGTTPTFEVAWVILRNRVNIEEEETERANQQDYCKYIPTKPLYDLKFKVKAITHFYSFPECKWLDLFEDIQAGIQNIGHTIGVILNELDINDRRLFFWATLDD